jgi:hypothetical protein
MDQTGIANKSYKLFVQDAAGNLSAVPGSGSNPTFRIDNEAPTASNFTSAGLDSTTAITGASVGTLAAVDPDAGETPARSCYILFSNSGRTHMCIQGGEVMPGYDGTHHTATHEDHREPALYLLRFLEKARPRDVQVLLRHDGEAVSAPPPKPRRCQRKSGPGAPEPADIRGQRVVRPRRQ